MIPQGLQLLYLPPFSIISRFFITALIFANLGIILLIYEYFLGNFNLQATVHTYTVGFLLMTMLGALFQMLPVVAGATLENPEKKATVVHIGLILGVIFLISGFLFYKKFLGILGLLILSLTIFYIASLMLYKLQKIKNLRDAPRGFKYALLSLIVGTLFAIILTLNFFGILNFNHKYLLDVHLSFMLYGLTATLVASVSFQVIEMFFVTPPYPKYLTKYLPISVFTLLVLKILGLNFVDFVISLIFVVYSVITILRLNQRKRKVPDPLVNLWIVSMSFLILSSIVFPFKDKLFLPFLILFGMFFTSVIMAMMFRIIPFLVWMHLSTKGVKNAPTMFEVINPKDIWFNFYLHLISIISLLFVIAGEPLITILAFGINFLTFLVNISSGVIKYVKHATI